jgi:hypothetical protein
MSEELQDDVEIVNEDQEAPPESGVFDSETPEDRAKRMGWKPKDEFQGIGEWVSAEEFLKRGENDPAELKRQNRTMERSIQKLEKSMEALLSHQQREIEAREKSAYERGYAAYEAQIDKAIEDGDTDAAKRAIKGRDELQKREHERLTQKKEEITASPQVNPMVQDWQKRNSWFGKDTVLTDYAQKHCDYLAKQGKSEEQQLKEVEAYIRETFPHKFRSKQAPMMPSGGTAQPKGKPKYGTYEALKPEYKAECDRNEKNGIKREAFLRYCEPEMFTVPMGE